MSEKPHEYNYPTSFDFSEWKRLWKYIVFLKKPFLWLLLASDRKSTRLNSSHIH